MEGGGVAPGGHIHGEGIGVDAQLAVLLEQPRHRRQRRNLPVRTEREGRAPSTGGELRFARRAAVWRVVGRQGDLFTVEVTVVDDQGRIGATATGLVARI